MRGRIIFYVETASTSKGTALDARNVAYEKEDISFALWVFRAVAKTIM